MRPVPELHWKAVETQNKTANSDLKRCYQCRVSKNLGVHRQWGSTREKEDTAVHMKSSERYRDLGKCSLNHTRISWEEVSGKE